MNPKWIIKWTIGLLIIAAAGGFLLFQSVKSSMVYYYSVDEYARLANDKPQMFGEGTPIRLAGWVQADSITHEPNDTAVYFVLTGRDHRIDVAYSGTVPANFAENKEVVVRGTCAPNGLAATQIMTRCESKYSSKLQEPNTLEPK